MRWPISLPEAIAVNSGVAISCVQKVVVRLKIVCCVCMSSIGLCFQTRYVMQVALFHIGFPAVRQSCFATGSGACLVGELRALLVRSLIRPDGVDNPLPLP